MAKSVLITYGGESLSFSPTRVDRAKIYGARKRIATDGKGRTCTRAALSADGSQLLVSGMTAQGYFAGDGRWVMRNEMVGIDIEGNQVETKSSTLGVPQVVEGPVDPFEILDLAVEGVFWLEPEQGASSLLDKLKGGDVYKFPFNYAAGLEVETAYLIANDEGFFALVGKPTMGHWLEEGEVFVPSEVEEETDDLDFEAL